MSRIIELFLSSSGRLQVERTGIPSRKDLQVYAAAVLVHGALADTVVSRDELRALVTRLSQQFDLFPEEAARIIEVSDVLRRHKKSLGEFLTALNERFERSQKITLLSMLWGVLKADGLFSEVEAIFASRVARELGLSTPDVEAAKKQVDTQAV